MTKRTAIFLLQFYEKIWINQGKAERIKKVCCYLPPLTKRLPIGVGHPPSQEQFCYYCDNISNNCGYVLIYGHAYHQECFTKLGSKYIYCYEYLPLSIDELTRSFNERLQMESENEFDSPSADDIYST
ncbi:hypothetical protein RhiirA4_543297 [Rhizophagus irregularis]|uniref:Uncharacterized protein n=1 Tax=Rhizophagus irregularis TaxID=588596 RepID=A0A2I1GIF5_9GLOM|nr:hypothetical protein RhiirA4_543297 [Rhizophagus irregularis]